MCVFHTAFAVHCCIVCLCPHSLHRSSHVRVAGHEEARQTGSCSGQYCPGRARFSATMARNRSRRVGASLVVARTRAAREKCEPGTVVPCRLRACGSTKRDEWVCACGAANFLDKGTCRKCGKGLTEVKRAAGAGECQRVRHLQVQASVSSVKIEVDTIVIEDEVRSQERLKALEAMRRTAKEIGDKELTESLTTNRARATEEGGGAPTRWTRLRQGWSVQDWVPVCAAQARAKLRKAQDAVKGAEAPVQRLAELVAMRARRPRSLPPATSPTSFESRSRNCGKDRGRAHTRPKSSPAVWKKRTRT